MRAVTDNPPLPGARPSFTETQHVSKKTYAENTSLLQMLIPHKCRKCSVSRRLPLLFLLDQPYFLPILEFHLPCNPGFALTPSSQGDLISTKRGLPDLPLQADFPQPSLVRGPSGISPWLSIPQPSSRLPSFLCCFLPISLNCSL